jgi:hypothetical protein
MAENLRHSLRHIVAAHKGWPKRNPPDKSNFITHHGWSI